MKIFVALASLLLIGCATSTPRYQSAVPARHGAVEYIGPSFHIEITTAGYVTVGLSTGIGGVAGFLIGRTIHIEDSTGKALNPNLVGALGAVAGAGGGYLLSSATIYSTAPRNQRLSIGRVDEWLVALDDQLILIDTVRDSRRRDTIGSLTAVSKSVGDTFRIYSIDDAAFFYETDRKTKLEDRIDALKPIVFQEKLGSIYDKSVRVAALASKIAAAIGALDIGP